MHSRSSLLTVAIAAVCVACGPAAVGPDAPGADKSACDYPQSRGNVLLDEPLPPFAWAAATSSDEVETRLDLRDVHNGVGEWSPFDVLVFIAIPSW